jgi:hypothetical protein
MKGLLDLRQHKVIMLLGWRDKGRISFQAASIRHVMLGAALVVPKDVFENDEEPGP